MPSIVIDGDKVLYKGTDLASMDFVIPRIPRTYAWFGYKILELLRDDVYMPIDPLSVVVSHNKFLTLLVLKEAGLPVPDTWMSVSRNTIEGMLDDMDFPVVMKLLYGSLGKGVMFADSKQSAKSFMDALERFKEPIFLEEYIPNPGEDIRVFVLGGGVLGAEKRIAQGDEHRTNIGIGGIGKPMKVSTRVKSMSVKAASVLGMDVTGIDVIQGPRGPVLLEANVNVHFEGLTKVLGINVAKKIVEYVSDEVKVHGQSKVNKFFDRIRVPYLPNLPNIQGKKGFVDVDLDIL